jgi:plasmid stabilization system protein ParE
MKYRVTIHQTAFDDIQVIADYIEKEYKAPATANNFLDGIEAALYSLELNASVFAVSTSPSLLKYGKNVRRINYKKFAIIYTIELNVVHVYRIIHGSLIID